MTTLNTAAVALMMTAILSLSASADVDPSLKAMLETAVKSGDPLQIAAIEKIAIATWPKEEAAIKAMIAKLKAPAEPSEVAEVKIVAQDAVKNGDIAKKPNSVNYYLNPALWNGQLELGGGTSSGNTSEQGMTVGLSFRRKFAENWEHDLDSNFDYAKSLGLVTKRKIIGDYKILLKPWDRFYAMNFLEIEADKFSGYKYRITENIGFGYEIINKSNMLWRIEGGPGIRYNKLYITNVGETELLGRLSNTFEMDVWKNIKLSNKTSIIFTDASTTFDNKAQLSARINAHMAAKLSFSVKHDTGAPLNKEKTDTISRATIVYDF